MGERKHQGTRLQDSRVRARVITSSALQPRSKISHFYDQYAARPSSNSGKNFSFVRYFLHHDASYHLRTLESLYDFSSPNLCFQRPNPLSQLSNLTTKPRPEPIAQTLSAQPLRRRATLRSRRRPRSSLHVQHLASHAQNVQEAEMGEEKEGAGD